MCLLEAGPGDPFREGKAPWNWDPGQGLLYFSPLLSEAHLGGDD
jgi:hypothetical protein